MNYRTVWTLQHGPYANPPLVSMETQLAIEAADAQVQAERDPQLTIEQIWAEQGAAMGYVRRKPVRRETLQTDEMTWLGVSRKGARG